MKIIQSVIEEPLFEHTTLPQGTLLFDIETTGLSADTSYLYLIGAVYYEREQLCLTQWFCDEYSEEKAVLTAFRDVIKRYPVLVHLRRYHNGNPFLHQSL